MPAAAMPWNEFDCGPAPRVGEMFADYPDRLHLLQHVAVHPLCYAPGGDRAGGNDCTSPDYNDLGYHWSTKYSAKLDASNSGLEANGALNAFQGSGNTWIRARSGPSRARTPQVARAVTPAALTA